MKLRVLIAGVVFGVAALAADTGAELFQKAVTQERAAGNLEEAIKLYQRVATEFASDRALAAKALVQEARCYEKLGQGKAVKLYEQVARDFKDQREPAATASARLALLRQVDRAVAPTTMTQRKIEFPLPNAAAVSGGFTDGQHFLYRDGATGPLMIGDLAGKEKRLVFKPNAGALVSYQSSRDYSYVAMGLTGADGSRKLAVIRTDGTGYREIAGDLASCQPDWSWDDRYVFVCEDRPDDGHWLVRVSAADGEIRKVQKTDDHYFRASPDGRFIAYSKLPTVVGGIYVGPGEGGQPQLVYENARLLDWTRDGRYLAITMDHSGSEALYLLPMKEGRAAGDPVFIRYGSFDVGRTSPSGSLVYQSTPQGGNFATWLWMQSSDGHSEGWKQLALSGSNQGYHAPTWSPDSSQIAYVAQNHAAGQDVRDVRLRTISTGEERLLFQGGAEYMQCLWAARRPSLFCVQREAQASKLVSISIESGRAERLRSLPVVTGPLLPDSDDSAVYMVQMQPLELIRFEIGTEEATTVDRSRGLIPLPGMMSRDGRWITRLGKGGIEIRPQQGGDWKPLLSLAGGYTEMALTPDGNWLYYHELDAAGAQSLFRVATSGGQPERLGDFPVVSRTGSLWISPDGQKIIAEVRNAKESWMLENFEPKQQAAK